MGNVGPYTRDIALKNATVLRRAKFNIGADHCLEAVRKVFGIDSDGTPTPHHLINKAGHFFHQSSDPRKAPPGACHVWVSNVKGRPGHIALVPKNRVRRARGIALTPGAPDDTATPINEAKVWCFMPITTISAKWNLRYMGWVEFIDGEKI